MRQIPRFGMTARGIASHSARNDKRMRELLRWGYTEKGAGQECPAYRDCWNNSSIDGVFQPRIG